MTAHPEAPARSTPGVARGRSPLPPWLNRDLRLLVAGRGLRSISQSYLAVIVPLYLAHMGYSAVRIGVFFTFGAVGSMALTAAVGVLSDRFGRKPLLVLLGLLTAMCGLVFVATQSFPVLLIAAAMGTIGRGGGAGSGGAFGPYAPAEQALIAEHAGNRHRTNAFGIVSVVGVLSAALGSLLATTPTLLHRVFGMSDLTAERGLFLLTAVLGTAMAMVVLPVSEAKRPVHKTGTRRRLTTRTKHVLVRFLVTNATNGLAVGMLGPILVYWFHVRYGATSGELGTLFFIANIASAPSNLASARVARRLGAVRAIVTARLTSVVLLAGMAVMPSFLWAAVFFLLRTQANTLSNPIRQSFLMGVVDEADRSTAAGLSNLPLQAFSSVGPTVAGQIMQVAWVSLPLELAAVLQGVNAALYFIFFRNIVPPEEQSSAS
ncbi:MAG TPA: MFS transporter [Gemmatimonadaceae bacterium]